MAANDAPWWDRDAHPTTQDRIEALKRELAEQDSPVVDVVREPEPAPEYEYTDIDLVYAGYLGESPDKPKWSLGFAPVFDGKIATGTGTYCSVIVHEGELRL